MFYHLKEMANLFGDVPFEPELIARIRDEIQPLHLSMVNPTILVIQRRSIMQNAKWSTLTSYYGIFMGKYTSREQHGTEPFPDFGKLCGVLIYTHVFRHLSSSGRSEYP